MRIVRGTADDIPRLEPLWLAMRDHHEACAPRVAEVVPFRDGPASWAVRSARYAEWIQSPDTALFVAEDDGGSALGYAFTMIGGREATLATGDRVGQLHALSVAPGARGQGVGSALIDAFLEHLRSIGVTEWSLGVLDGNHDAQRLYERYGLRPYYVEMLGPVLIPSDAVERT